MKVDPVQVLLLRIFMCTAFGMSVAWIIDYSRTRWWRNVVGQNLVAKTSIISALLLISILGSFLRLSPGALITLRWAYIVLLACIGPVMAWRMVVFSRVSGAVHQCLNGHWVSDVARYCPVCGIPIPGHPDERAAD